MSNYGKVTRKQKKQAKRAEATYDPELFDEVYDILINRRTTSAKKVQAEDSVFALCWVSYDKAKDEYTPYTKDEKEKLEKAGINLNFEERLVRFYGDRNDDFEVKSRAQTARYKASLDCKLTDKEQTALEKEEQVAGIEEKRAELLKACEDRGLLPERLSKEELERQQTAIKFAEALGLQIPIFDNQLPSNEVLIERIATGCVESDAAVASGAPAALPDKATELPSQLTALVENVVEQVLKKRDAHPGSGKAGTRTERGQKGSRSQKDSRQPAGSRNQHGGNQSQNQQSQRPSPNDFGNNDDDDDQSQGQGQQSTQDNLPFTFDEDGNILGLDEKGTAAVLQQYESAKNAAGSKGGNA